MTTEQPLGRFRFRNGIAGTDEDGGFIDADAYVLVDDPEPPAEPPVEPPVEPELGMRGNLPGVELTQRSGRIEVGDGETLENVTGGYISVAGDNATVRNLYLPASTAPETGDHVRTDAVGRIVRDTRWENLHLGGKTNPAPGKHLDSWQGHSAEGGGIWNQWFIDSIIHGSASGALFTKDALIDGAVFGIDNCWIGKATGSYAAVKLYATRGRCTFYARDSEIAEVELLGDWVRDIARCDIPGGLTVNGSPA